MCVLRSVAIADYHGSLKTVPALYGHRPCCPSCLPDPDKHSRRSAPSRSPAPGEGGVSAMRLRSATSAARPPMWRTRVIECHSSSWWPRRMGPRATFAARARCISRVTLCRQRPVRTASLASPGCGRFRSAGRRAPPDSIKGASFSGHLWSGGPVARSCRPRREP
jgi:hypothetical protein